MRNDVQVKPDFIFFSNSKKLIFVEKLKNAIKIGRNEKCLEMVFLGHHLE